MKVIVFFLVMCSPLIFILFVAFFCDKKSTNHGECNMSEKKRETLISLYSIIHNQTPEMCDETLEFIKKALLLKFDPLDPNGQEKSKECLFESFGKLLICKFCFVQTLWEASNEGKIEEGDLFYLAEEWNNNWRKEYDKKTLFKNQVVRKYFQMIKEKILEQVSINENLVCMIANHMPLENIMEKMKKGE